MCSVRVHGSAPAGESEEAAQIAQHCQELLHQPKAGEHVASVWGCGAGLVLDETRAAMSRILKVPAPPKCVLEEYANGAQDC